MIPNILTTARLAMVPLFAYFMLAKQNLKAGAIIFVLAGITDVIDGFIARHFNMITNFGMIYDPFADKLMQITAIVCLAVMGLIPKWLLIMVIVKEVTMIVIGGILYPTTQRDLVYYLLKTINHGRKHRLVVTTHSPYILHAFNNSMLLGQVKEMLPKEMLNHLDCKEAAISPDLVSVWQIKDGVLVNIKDARTNTIGKHYFNDVMNDMLDDYYQMLPFVKITKS